MLTRIFKSGNSLAVRIPQELAFIDAAQDVEIERVGNTLVVRPRVHETVGDLSDVFAAFPQSFMAGGREFHEQHDRDWSGFGTANTAAATKVRG
ncbi:MAG: AbrB/MazE/SpoVT family DNA-binding domain-containing protein [Burkholderiales bacterium]|nr:AbrB/MazE/SpoVT family DNA-binding domain-containing protein [Burkholderiales bacterium]